MIRPVSKNDLNRWRELFDDYARFYKTSVSDDAAEKVWEWIHNPEEDFWCSVVESSTGALVGFTQYQLMHRSLGGGKVVYLSDLYVMPEQRGQGLARQLIDHVFEFANSQGYSNVRWLTQESNYTARQLYDSYQSKSEFILYSINT